MHGVSGPCRHTKRAQGELWPCGASVELPCHACRCVSSCDVRKSHAHRQFPAWPGVGRRVRRRDFVVSLALVSTRVVRSASLKRVRCMPVREPLALRPAARAAACTCGALCEFRALFEVITCTESLAASIWPTRHARTPQIAYTYHLQVLPTCPHTLIGWVGWGGRGRVRFS